MVIKNKKANPSWFLITIIISIISFLLYLVVFSNITGNVVSEVDEISCRAYISLKDVSGVKLGEFFYTINEKCKKNNIKINSLEKEEIFQEVGDLMKGCWYRYGEGETDFLSNYRSTGKWCFLCGEIEFGDKASENAVVYSFEDFIKWANKTTFNLKDGNKISYYEYMNLNSFQLDYLNSLNDDNLSKLILQEINRDLRLKEINPNYKNYVIYRYDRLDDSFLNKILANGTMTPEEVDNLNLNLALMGPGIGIMIASLNTISSLHSSVSNQYVDIMTQEQYYRLCGTQVGSFD